MNLVVLILFTVILDCVEMDDLSSPLQTVLASSHRSLALMLYGYFPLTLVTKCQISGINPL